jgi:hypothetical protein
MAITPRGLRAAGKRLWRAVNSEFDIDDHEAALLREACRTVDQLDQLQAVLAQTSLVVGSNQGIRVHPALVESRQQRLVLAKLVTSLRLPAGIIEDAVP